MLMLTDLIGFGGLASPPVVPPPAIRFTNRYAFAYSSTTSATVTVPGADLGAADPTKQILVVVPAEAPIVTGVTINGVTATPVSIDPGVRINMFSAPYTGSGPFNIVVTIAATATESNSLIVYEINNALPLYKGQRCAETQSAITSLAAQTRVPVNGLVVAGAMDTTDTVTFSWSSLTEDVDADGGDSRVGSAKNATNAVAVTDLTETLTISASSLAAMNLLTILPTDQSGVLGGSIVGNLVTASGSTATNAHIVNFTGMGDFKLVVGVIVEADVTISGATFNGNAMTSIGSAVNTGASPDILCHFFHIDVTQAGGASGNIVVTASGTISAAPVCIAKWALYNVGSISAVQSSSGNAAGAAISIDVAAGGTILALHVRSDNTQTTSWTGAAEVFDFPFQVITAFRGSAAQYSYAAAETGRVIQASGTSGQYATLAVAFNP